MRNIFFFLFLSVTCYGQQPAVMDPILVQDLDFTPVRPEFGKVYRVMLRKDHALLAEGIADSTWVTICYGCQMTNTPPPVAQIDTIDSEALVYEGWARHGATSAAGWYKGTISYSNAGTASYNFNGKRIEIWGERGNHGTATVIVDGISHSVSWQGESGLPVLMFGKDLPAGDHSLVISPVGNGNVLIDYLIVKK